MSGHFTTLCMKVLRNSIKVIILLIFKNNFTIFPIYRSSLGLRPATLLKKKLWHRCFPVNFVKFSRTPFLIEHLRWLLYIQIAQINTLINSAKEDLRNFSKLLPLKAAQEIIFLRVLGETWFSAQDLRFKRLNFNSRCRFFSRYSSRSRIGGALREKLMIL